MYIIEADMEWTLLSHVQILPYMERYAASDLENTVSPFATGIRLPETAPNVVTAQEDAYQMRYGVFVE